ncbi:hypothetical protein FACS189472_18940 [Alphaproteobacteria bacterium]|nr:hypothetical protein FACS189472_18940 [Alphaproteobacteria bacterium]
MVEWKEKREDMRNKKILEEPVRRDEMRAAMYKHVGLLLRPMMRARGVCARGVVYILSCA